ncbi:unnamed protein product [Ectocarpus sp. 12 AP-2014]
MRTPLPYAHSRRRVEPGFHNIDVLVPPITILMEQSTPHNYNALVSTPSTCPGSFLDANRRQHPGFEHIRRIIDDVHRISHTRKKLRSPPPQARFPYGSSQQGFQPQSAPTVLRCFLPIFASAAGQCRSNTHSHQPRCGILCANAWFLSYS